MSKFIFLLLLLPVLAYSQYEVKGKVEDKTGKPIEYSEVILHALDSTDFMPTLTDEHGIFALTDITEGDYELILRYFSQEIFSQTISVKGDLDLGTIIVDATSTLDEIVVAGEKPIIERMNDRLVFNVENSVAVTGGNGLDALKLTPRIKVKDNMISMTGKGNLLIMVDDRIVSMTNAELANYLRSLNADDIQRIEVIPNPPAKYTAEGNSGLVNIVFKKLKNDAWNASLNSTYRQASYGRGTIGGSFHLKKGKVRLNSSINYTNGSIAPQYSTEINYPNLFWDQVQNYRRYSDALSCRLGLDYEINKKHTTGFNIDLYKSKPSSTDENKTKLYNSTRETVDSLIVTSGRNVSDYKYVALNYYYTYIVDTVGRNLSLDFDYFDHSSHTNRVFSTETFLTDNHRTSIVGVRNFGVQRIENYSINLDMDHPAEWATFNYGGRISLTKTDNLFDYYDRVNNLEILNSNYSNQFIYEERIQALYLSVEKSFSDHWDAEIGLRYEFTQNKGFSKSINQSNNNRYSKLFPTVYISYNRNDNHLFNINYGRRIKRPRYGFLDPFRFVENQFSYVEGNPFLQPAFIDNFEFQYTYKNNLMTSVYFSHTNDDFEQATFIDEATNTQIVKPYNFIINKTYGINQVYVFDRVSWLSANASVDVYYSDTDSKIDVTLQFLSGWNAEFSLSNDFVLNQNKTLLANLSYSYYTSGVDNLDYNSSSSQLDASIKCLLLKRKLTISLAANNILRTNIVRYTSYTYGIKYSWKNYFDDRFIRLGITFDLGEKFGVNRRESKNQDEKDRTN